MKRRWPVVWLTLAAGLGAASFACAHLDYRERERIWVRARAEGVPADPAPDGPALYAAIGLGIAAAMTGTAGAAMAITESRRWRGNTPGRVD